MQQGTTTDAATGDGMADRARVDVLALEDFHRNLDARLSEVDSAIRKLGTEMGATAPALGTFTDARQRINRYTTLRGEHLDRLKRLRTAITAAQTATATILNNYRTAEARNRASAADIASVLGGVDSALRKSGGASRA